MTDPLDALYRQNPEYQPHHDGTFWLLSNAAGWGIACDALLHRTWSAFDGRPTVDVVREVSAETGASTAFTESSAKVLARAGVLKPSQPLPPLAHHVSSEFAGLSSLPLVSVIVLAGPQARDHLATCLPSILAQTYPNLEVILVDNQTADDSVPFTEQSFPQVKVLSTGESLGFDAANNLAMKQARGDYFVLLNDDTEMESSCVAECLRVMSRSDKIAVVVPKMKLFYLRSFLNSIGNSLYPDGLSCDNFVGYLDVGQFDDIDQVFSACFGAAMLRRSVIEEIGYLDENYSFYFEDMDWSFRARLSGYDIVAAPRAVVYHKFNASMDKLPSTFKLGLVAHNRVRFVWKNLNTGRAWRFARIYRAEALRHILWAMENQTPGILRAYCASWLKWLRLVPNLAIARWQTRRSRHPGFSDDATFALVDRIPRPLMYGRYPLINVPAVRDHYMQLEIFAPDSPLVAESPTTVVTPLPAADLAVLMKKARKALREMGIPGLLRESRRYFCWRYTIRKQK
jgi:GT2 family glycosyltransferase